MAQFTHSLCEEVIRTEGRCGLTRNEMVQLANLALRVLKPERASVWIPVTERLPDDDMSVMIALRDDADDVWIGWHDGEMGWVCDNGPLGERVTHWMPLPNGPKP